MTSKSKIEVYKVGCFPNYRYQNGANTYISAGLDPFTNGNKLSYSTLHFTDNVTKTIGKHTLLFGGNFEYFKSSNLFFQLLMGLYFNSLADFYAAANESLALNGAPSVTNLQLVHSLDTLLCQGAAEPLQIYKSNKLDLYTQDEIKFSDRFKMTIGLRARVWFANTALENPAVTALTLLMVKI
jgi:outer membrane receptor protein involved in Fe transport